MIGSTLIVAHRGASEDNADNSVEAFEAAIKLGADMIEFDVRRTKDNKLIAFHDSHVQGKALSILDRSDVAALTGSEPPLLDHVLEITKDRIALDIELKERGYVEAVVSAVVKHASTKDTVYTSFLDEVVAQIRGLQPTSQAGLLLGIDKPKALLRTRLSELFPINRARACDASFIAPHYKLANAGVLTRARRAGIKCFVWTVNDDVQIGKLLQDPRVAAIITDRPARALSIRRSYESSQ